MGLYNRGYFVNTGGSGEHLKSVSLTWLSVHILWFYSFSSPDPTSGSVWLWYWGCSIN